MGLQNLKDYRVFAISVEVVGDICCALNDKILPFCHGIMSHLLAYFPCGVKHPSVTPLIFSCYGNTALAIGEHFEKYLPYAMPMMRVASEICVKMDPDNEEKMNYSNQLRSGIFDAYSGILWGLRNSKPELMLPHAGHLLQVIELVFRDKMREESVSKAAVAAMGDLAHALGPSCLESDDYKMKEIATWTQRMIERVFACERPDRKRRKLLVSNLIPPLYPTLATSGTNLACRQDI
ncbi:hypothetical protein MKX01_019244 [Papaver californicum]|nr:hypothetical protein MKX01_019244 [Papaver californicum]